MGVTTTQTNKPINPRGNDQSPKGYNRAKLYSGKALDFDGVNDYVDLAGFTMSGSVASFSFYVNADNTGNVYFLDANPNRFVLRFSNNNVALFSGSLVEFEAIKTNEWTHLVYVLNGTSAKCYANGVQLGTEQTITAIDLSAATDFDLGRWYLGGAFYDGGMSNLKIFNTALTAAQVADLYNNPEKVVPTGLESNLKLWLPMMEGAGTTAYDGSPVGFTEDIVTGFTNGTTYPLDSFASSGDDITTAIKTNGFGGCVSNGHYYTNGQKVKVKFTYQKNSGDNLRVLFSNAVTGAGTAKSDSQNVSASGEFEHTFTMTADGVAYLQLGTGNASHSIDAVITDVYVSPNVSANHGTIAGATYVNGVGAPVAQSAVISWNKGVNVISDSEDLTQWDTLVSGTGSVSVTANYAEAPNGTQTADRVQASAGDGYGLKSRSAASSVTGDYVVGVWAKSNTGSSQNAAIYGRNNVSNVVVVTTEWTQIVKPSSGTSNFINVGSTSSSDANVDILLWGGQMEQNTTTLGPYIPTLSTAQTTPVLLPQGLTTGRDITGVNLFENVRKQGALNLDGSSWSEVHDNASLDISPAMTMECWVDFSEIDSTAIRHFIIKPSGATWATPYARYALRASNASVQWWFESAGYLETYSVALTGWNHFAVTKDGTAEILYINGAQVDTATNNATITASAENLLLGQATTGTEPLDSQIAQPRIYNRALTAEEVQRNYNAGKNTYTN